LFGSQQQQPQQAGGLFGQQQQQQQQQPQQAGGMFGARPGGLFGSTAQQPTGLMGSTAQPQGSGLFGSMAQQGQQSMQQSMLGGTQGPPGLGASVALGSSRIGQEESIETRIVKIKNGWDVNSPDCRFKYYFYNVVAEGTTQFYVRPPGATDDVKWARAVRDNPDPTTWVILL
jgi:nuclear pore complex protein Nup54